MLHCFSWPESGYRISSWMADRVQAVNIVNFTLMAKLGGCTTAHDR